MVDDGPTTDRRSVMRKVIVPEFVTLDGVIEAPDQWSFQF